MKDDGTKNIDAGSKVKAFRQDFPPGEAAIYTSWWPADIEGKPAVIGHARVVRLDDDKLLSEAFATRGLRPLVAGVNGMKDTRDAERAQTGAVGRALFLMGYGDKADDSADYEEPADENQWYVENGWRGGKEHHDTQWADLKEAAASLVDHQEEIREVWKHSYHLPLTKKQADEWEAFLRDLKDSGAGDRAGDELAPDSSEAVGPDAPIMAGKS